MDASSSMNSVRGPVVCRAISRTGSIGSSRDIPPFQPLPDEPAHRLTSLKRSLSGRLSGSLLSPTARQSSTKTFKTSSSSEQSENSGSGVCGIRNVGNSCYQNSVIQFLNAIPEVVNSLADAESWSASPKIALELRQLLRDVSSASEHSVVNTLSLRRSLGALDRKWNGYGQEDAHEFLTQIISTLQEDCNRNASKPSYVELKDCSDVRQQATGEWKYSKKWNDSDIDDIFGFQIHNQITCPDCKHQSNRFGYLTSLEVPLPEAQASLQDCLVDFSSPEMLDDDNSWNCPKCKRLVQGVKQLRLSRLPKVLIVCLKRFGTTNSRFLSFRSWKNNVALHLPEGNISLQDIFSPTMDATAYKNSDYELVAVVDHSGSVNFGHYTARVKNKAKDGWYLLNDEIVQHTSQPVGPSESAYILALRQVEKA